MSLKVIIPARMASERLPGKPLLDIAGVPMVIRVAQTAIAAVGEEHVIISTPDAEIISAANAWGVSSIESSLDCKSGTDRVAEFASKYFFDSYINVQGDEPMLSKEVLSSFIRESENLTDSSIGITRLEDASLVSSESVVKVAVSGSRALYASRSPLPSVVGQNEIGFFKHTGLYSFRKKDLDTFASLEKGPLEQAENAEILRLIEHGVSIGAIPVPYYGRAVDTQMDFDYVSNHEMFS